MKSCSLLAMTLLGSLGACVSSAARVPDFIPQPFHSSVDVWLEAHPRYRLAVPEDCQCNDDIETLRRGVGAGWKPQPNYQPYNATADFDGDRLEDIALIALSSDINEPILVLVVHGAPPGTKQDVLEVPQAGASVAGRGLFLGAAKDDRARDRTRLLFGAFASEAEEVRISR